MDVHLILVIVIVAALAFDYTNGFHDTANVVATSISTGAASPKAAVAFAAVLNFVGAFISIEVATTIAKDVIDPQAIAGGDSLNVVYSGLMGAIAWNLITWYFGLPSSSSHALIGGIVGAAVAAVGTGAVETAGLIGKVLVPAIVAPILAFLVAGAAIAICYQIIGKLRPGPVTRGYRYGQIVSGGLLALAHGTNDAQKTMGVITLALIADGALSPGSDPPIWVIVSAASAIALGTYSGGWRIIKTTGTKIIKMDAAQGFSAQGAGAAVIMASSHFGFPLSTTHVINGGVMGAGVAKRLSAVRWGVAGNIVGAWVLTLPAAAAIGAFTYGVTVVTGGGAVGPVAISAISLVLIAGAFVRRARMGAPAADGTGAPITEDAASLIVEGGEVMTVDGKPVTAAGIAGSPDEPGRDG